MTDHHASVEQLVRSKLAEAFGGARGVVESAVPTIVFTVCWIVTNDLRTSLVASVGTAVVLVAVRLVQRSSPQFVLNALVGIAIAAVFASRSGEARDVFLPGILYNGAYAAVFILSILVGWPIVGFLIGSLTGEPTEWHDDQRIVRLCSTLTWLFAVPRTVGRVNHPSNEWLFGESWGVDVAVSTPRLMSALVEEAVSVGDLVRLFTFRQSNTSLVELTMPDDSPYAGTLVRDVPWPRDVVLVAILRDNAIETPDGHRALEAGDELLFVTAEQGEDTIAALLSPRG